jgi:transposase InsO family protein
MPASSLAWPGHLDDAPECRHEPAAQAASWTSRGQRSCQHQAEARRTERMRRMRVVEFAQWARDQKWPTTEAAAVTGMPRRTLSSWCRAWKVDGLAARPRGRPPVEIPLEQCCAVTDFLDDHGPIVGLPALQSHYAHMPRVVLGEVLGSFRDAWRREHRRVTCELEWTRPGAIWAVDFTHPPRLVDGVYPAILNVVDLGSRQQLLWLATVGEDAGTVRDALGDLFEQHGAPLVIKSDNGSAFRAAAMKDLLADWSVFPLFSPPYCASYNGVCERANQTMKLMTAHVAERADRGDWWRSEDLHEARLLANGVRRPWGALGPSPDQSWATQNFVSLDERQNMWQEIERRRVQIREARGIDLEVSLPHYAQAEIDRDAASPVLAELGYYKIKRRRYTPAI